MSTIAPRVHPSSSRQGSYVTDQGDLPWWVMPLARFIAVVGGVAAVAVLIQELMRAWHWIVEVVL